MATVVVVESVTTTVGTPHGFVEGPDACQRDLPPKDGRAESPSIS